MINIKLLVAILDEGYGKKYNALLNKFGIKVKTVTKASGTASPSLLDYFGLVESRKEVFISVIPDVLADDIYEKVTEGFNLKREGTGILFSVPIASSNKFLVDSFAELDGGEVKVSRNKEKKYYLVIAIVLEGYLEQVMAAVKRAGASGGTVIKGRELASRKAGKILGFNIEPERDIVLSIVDEETKNKVMTEITESVGVKTKAKGVCIALPVEDAVGLASDIL